MSDSQIQNSANTPSLPADVAARHWQQLLDIACSDSQLSPARLLRTEGMLQMALELGAVDAGTLEEWGTLAARRVAAAIPNPLWPVSLIDVDKGEVRIILLHKRAPVHPTTKS